MAKKKRNLNAQVSDDFLESASGGAVFNAKGFGHNETPWEAIDDTSGKVLGEYKTKREAVRAARDAGQSIATIDYDTVAALRGH